MFITDITAGGGAERMVANMCQALSNKYSITILSQFRYFGEPKYEIPSNVNIIYLSKVIGKYLQKYNRKIVFKFIANIRLNKIIKNQMRKSNSSHAIIMFHYVYVMLPILLKNVRYVRVVHINYDGFIECMPKKFVSKYENFTLKKFFVPSLEMFNDFVLLSTKELDKWRNMHKNIRVIPNFLPSIPQECADVSNKVVASIGRLVKQKGFVRLIKIWEMMWNKYADNMSGWQLHIVGDGWQKEDVLNAIENIQNESIRESIKLLEFTTNIREHYLNAGIYAMTSLFEGLPMVLLEASSYALPCISFDITSGPSDVIDDNKSGFLIEDGNFEEFANKLLELIKSESLRKQMGLNAKQKIKDYFSKDVVVQKWENLFIETQINQGDQLPKT